MPAPPTPLQRHPRLVGLALLGGAAVLGKLTIWDPLRDAAAHVSSVSLSEAVAIVPPFAILGLFLVLAGPRAQAFFDRFGGAGKKLTKSGLAIVAVLVAIGFAVSFVLRQYLEGRGYK